MFLSTTTNQQREKKKHIENTFQNEGINYEHFVGVCNYACGKSGLQSHTLQL